MLSALLEKVKGGDAETLANLMQTVLPCVSHDISQTELLKLLALVPAVLEYDTVEQRIPYEDLYHSENEMLVPDMEETVKRLQETIYQTEE